MKTKMALISGFLLVAVVGFVVAYDAGDHVVRADTTKPTASTAVDDHAAMKHEHHGAGTTLTVSGEVLDLACYMAHEGKGEKHKSCAQSCIDGGAPIGVLTASGEVYLIVEDHEVKKPYTVLKGKAAEQVKVTGTLQERGGLRAIVLSAVE